MGVKGENTLPDGWEMVPLGCIDYVVIPEMCHLRVLNHGAEFYRLLVRCMPDWAKRKERLDSFTL